jgi:hypothetical protein
MPNISVVIVVPDEGALLPALLGPVILVTELDSHFGDAN